MSYAWEKYYLAVRTLALGKGQIKERLTNACVHHLYSLLDYQDQLPLDRRRKYRDMIDEVTSLKSIPMSIEQMDEERAVKLADQIIEGFVELDQQAIARDVNEASVDGPQRGSNGTGEGSAIPEKG